jgi:hypothetical protein
MYERFKYFNVDFKLHNIKKVYLLVRLTNIFIVSFANPVALVEHAIMMLSVDTTFIIENPIATTCFGFLQQPSSGRTYQKM